MDATESSARSAWAHAGVGPWSDRRAATATAPCTTRDSEFEALARYRTIFEGAAMGILRVDRTGQVVEANPAIEKMLGYSASELMVMRFQEYTHADDVPENLRLFHEIMEGPSHDYQFEKRCFRKDGTMIWTRVTAVAERDANGVRTHAITMLEDVTARKVAEQAVLEQARLNEHQALHDALTGLGNRRKLLVALDAALAGGAPLLLALFDLDGFKRYNDTFGHPAGDDLLVRLSTRLRQAMPHDTAYRLGGDEFLVLTRAEGDIERLLEQAACALSEDGHGFAIRASFGAALLPEETGDASTALELCDQRLYNEKSRRSDRRGRPQDVLLEALTAREPTLEFHSTEVANLAVSVGARLGLDAETLTRLRQAALLHDIGKIGIPDSVLVKPGPLSCDEWAFVRRHTIIGERILAASPALRDVARIVRSTHENIDGTGYPDALHGTDIPIEARVISACDAYSAMTAARAYRPALSHTEALAELERCAGTQFDVAIVDVLILAVAAHHLAQPE